MKNEMATGEHKGTANLIPWKPGESGNPRGRPGTVKLVSEWLRQMHDWKRSQLQAVCDDDDSPATQVLAARRLLGGMAADESPNPGADFDRVTDRTEGKPRQSVQVVSMTIDPASIITDRIAAELGQAVGGLIEGDMEPIALPVPNPTSVPHRAVLSGSDADGDSAPGFTSPAIQAQTDIGDSTPQDDPRS